MNSNWARIQRYKDFKDAFSLLEMMVVLLIVAILAAATAPMVTKKMARNAGSGDSPWVFTGLNSSIAYNLNGNDNAPVIIGASSTPASLTAPTRLFIDSGNTASAIAFGNGNDTPIGITADPTNGRIGISNQQVPNSSIAFGAGQTISNNPTGIIALGQGVKIVHNNDIVIGNNAQTSISDLDYALDVCNIAIGGGLLSQCNKKETMARNGSIAIGGGFSKFNKKKTMARNGSIAIGTGTRANGEKSIAIGQGGCFQPADSNSPSNPMTTDNQTGTTADAKYSIAFGFGARVGARNGIAIGTNTLVLEKHDNSVAIGYKAETTAPNQIVLGTDIDTVYIPGNLIVGKDAYIGSSYGKFTGSHFRLFLKRNDSAWTQLSEPNGSSDNTVKADYQNVSLPWSSDRRLKNVGEAYTAGLDELKKLDFFHYTFKKDEAKTPHVGVMAQDLQKVFPDAVTEGDDGYLRIRMEDMFYAVINAVKELDKKITQIVENVTSLSKKVDEQEKIIAEQQKLIEELQAQNAEFEKRLTKIEKKAK